MSRDAGCVTEENPQSGEGRTVKNLLISAGPAIAARRL
jgi:hypothetical protein